jgi:aflatoxin B1 aldehyde reductase
MKIPVPRLYLGTMTMGWSQTSSKVDESVALDMLKLFVMHNVENGIDTHYVDTARVYAGGKTEHIVGKIINEFGLSSAGIISVGTKAHPSVKPGLSPEGIRFQIKESLEAMNVPGVSEYYLHQPDTEHDLLDSLKEADAMIKEGLCCTLGMSNYHASEMKRAFDLCEEHNLTRPTVYQGLYNPLNRLVETELLPLLKANQCSFVAYNPLAAGLLTGKHQPDGAVPKGRFKENPNYLPRFYTDKNFEAVELIRKACEVDGIVMVEATYKWLMRHSSLTDDDGVLLGASSILQLKQNLAACAGANEVLSPQLLDAFDAAWKLTEEGAFPYWRSYSADMPGRESMNPGASYDAKKILKK